MSTLSRIDTYVLSALHPPHDVISPEEEVAIQAELEELAKEAKERGNVELVLLPCTGDPLTWRDPKTLAEWEEDWREAEGGALPWVWEGARTWRC